MTSKPIIITIPPTVFDGSNVSFRNFRESRKTNTIVREDIA
jgi:hypothetical protein